MCLENKNIKKKKTRNFTKVKQIQDERKISDQMLRSPPWSCKYSIAPAKSTTNWRGSAAGIDPTASVRLSVAIDSVTATDGEKERKKIGGNKKLLAELVNECAIIGPHLKRVLTALTIGHDV